MDEASLARWLALAGTAVFQSAGPVLAVAAGVGFLVALVQGVTQVQDQTLPLTLKILAVGALLASFGAAFADPVVELAEAAFAAIPEARR